MSITTTWGPKLIYLILKQNSIVMRIVKDLGVEDISVLGHPTYLTSINDAVDYGYVLDDFGRSVGFVIKKKYHFWKLLQIPGPISGIREDLPLEEQKKFYNDAITVIKKQYSIDEIANINTSPTVVYPQDSVYCKFGSYIIDLTQSEEELFSGLHSKHRNVVRKAEKDGLIVDFGPQYLEECAKLMDDTFKRQNGYSNASKELQTLMKLNDHCDFWVVKDGNELQGCAILLWDKYSSYYLHGGSASHTHSGAMNLLHWKAILKMKERGVHYYDFVGARLNPEEGSKLEGIQRFKSRFGGPMKVGYLWRVDLKPFKMKLYRFLMSTYFKLKGAAYSDIIDTERAKGNY